MCTISYTYLCLCSVVQRFLRHPKVTLNNQDISGCTPLHLACQQGHSTVAEMLIKSGARIDLK